MLGIIMLVATDAGAIGLVVHDRFYERYLEVSARSDSRNEKTMIARSCSMNKNVRIASSKRRSPSVCKGYSRENPRPTGVVSRLASCGTAALVAQTRCEAAAEAVT